jgi:hypothetical protein
MEKAVVIGDRPEDRNEAAVERMVGVLDIRRRSNELGEAQRKRREKRRAKEALFGTLDPQGDRLSRFIDALLSDDSEWNHQPKK